MHIFIIAVGKWRAYSLHSGLHAGIGKQSVECLFKHFNLKFNSLHMLTCIQAACLPVESIWDDSSYLPLDKF